MLRRYLARRKMRWAVRLLRLYRAKGWKFSVSRDQGARVLVLVADNGFMWCPFTRKSLDLAGLLP